MACIRNCFVGPVHLQAGQAQALCNSVHGCGRTESVGRRHGRARWVTWTTLRSSDSSCMEPGFKPTPLRTPVHQFTVSFSQVLLPT